MTGSPAVNVLGVIAAMLMIEAVSAATTSDSSYLGNWARADGKTHIRVEPVASRFAASTPGSGPA